MKKRYFMLIFIIMGIGGLVACVPYTAETIDFLNRAEKTEAVVVDYVEEYSGSDWSTYPIFQFHDINGIENYRQGSWNVQYEIGEKVEIYYDPEQPNGLVYAGTWAVWGPSLILFAFGLGFFGIGLTVFLKWDDWGITLN
jgi:hypothetical protein